MKTTKRLPRELTPERIYDFLIDVMLRHKRQSQDSVSDILKQHALDASLHRELVECGFLKQDGKRNVYAGNQPDKEIAHNILVAYRIRTTAPKILELPENVNSTMVHFDEDLGKKIDRLTTVVQHLYKELTGRELHL